MMNKLSDYVYEKLNLNKKDKIVSNNIIDIILSVCDIKKEYYNIKNYNILYNGVEKWVNDNDVNSIDIYMSDSYSTDKHISKMPNEIANKVNIISFDNFYDLFIRVFPDGTDFNKITLCKNGNIDIYGNEKALCMQNQNISLLVNKTK